MELLYISRTNNVISKKGDLWEMRSDHVMLIHQRTRDAVPMKLIRDFDKNFIALHDPKTFKAGGINIYVTKEGINVDGKDVDPAQWCHYAELFDGVPFKVQVVRYEGVHMTIEQMKAVKEYYQLLLTAA